MFARLADHAPVGLFVAKSDGGLTYVNERWCEMTGLRAEEGLEDGWAAAIHPEDRVSVVAGWREAVAGHQPLHQVCRFLRPDGRTVWIEVNASPIDSHDGGEHGFIGSILEITEKRQADALTRLHEAMFATSPDFAYVFDPQHRFIYVNQSLLNMWGKDWNESIGKTCLELGYPDWHAEMHNREIDLVVATKMPFRGEVPFNGVHGRRIYEYIFTPVIGKNGEVEAVAGATRDVTERKQAEERATLLSSLAGQLAPLTSAAEIIRVTVAMLGTHLNVHRCYFVECLKSENLIRVSENWVRDDARSLQGDLALDDFGGDEWWARYSGGNLAVEDVETDPITIERVGNYRRVGVRSFAVQPFKRTGTWTVILAVTEEIPRKWTVDEMELLDNVVARVWPLVEQARSLEAIRKSQQRLALIAETGRLILESETPSDMLHKMCEVAASHLNAEICLTLIPGPAGAHVEYETGLPDGVARRIGDIYFTAHEAQRDTKSGDVTDAAERSTMTILSTAGARGCSVHPLLVGDELLGVMIFASRGRGEFSPDELEFLDTISQYVTGAYVRLRLLDSLRESDRRKDHFLATLAHELRNPLAPVLTGLEIIKRSKNDPASVDRIIGIIERQTGQMAHLIDDLLDISRVNTGKITLKKESVHFAEVLRNAIEATQPLFEERRHQLAIDLPDDAILIDADPSRISQVISNLLSNAAKYTPAGGRIELQGGIDGGTAWVRVKDNGMGIEIADQQSIFDLFHQNTNGSADGLGIGLTLVKSLVEMHGGAVTVSSAGQSQGSEFQIRLPGAVLENPTEDLHPDIQATAGSGLKRVLVVDDGKNAADMLALFFELEGLEVEVAYNGLEGLQKARAMDPDFVIMDIGMPVMDGLEAARRMRAEKVRAKLIALSGWGRTEDKARTAEAGFDHHMIKPVKPEDLRAVMAKYFPDQTAP